MIRANLEGLRMLGSHRLVCKDARLPEPSQIKHAAGIFRGPALRRAIPDPPFRRNASLAQCDRLMTGLLMRKSMAAALTKRSMTRTALLSLVLTLVQGTGLPAQDNGSGPLVAAALACSGGPAVYLGSGLLLTAAHLVNPGADLSVVIARAKLPAKVLKQGAYEGIDLSLLHIDKSKLPPTLPAVQLCSAPPWPGDPVIFIDAGRATRSTIVAPGVLTHVPSAPLPNVDQGRRDGGQLRIGRFQLAILCNTHYL